MFLETTASHSSLPIEEEEEDENGEEEGEETTSNNGNEKNPSSDQLAAKGKERNAKTFTRKEMMVNNNKSDDMSLTSGPQSHDEDDGSINNDVTSVSSACSSSIDGGGSMSSSSYRQRSSRMRSVRSQRAFDGNMSMGNVAYNSTSTSSNSSGRGGASSIASGGGGGGRPSGMEDRMRQRLQTAKSERSLRTGTGRATRQSVNNNTLNSSSNRSVASTRSTTTGGGSVRDRLSALAKVPSIRRNNGDDDALLLQLTQKVRQLEEEKSRLVNSHEEILQEYEEKMNKMIENNNHNNNYKKNGARNKEESMNNSVTHQDNNADLQAKLNAALEKIKRLEQDQKEKEDLEEQLSSAQTTIIRLQATAAKPLEHMRVTPEKNSTAKRLDASSPYSSGDDEVASYSSECHNKIEKLKSFRRSRESQLKELVLDSQNSPTDVQQVIVNLQEELKVAKILIEKQKVQLEHTMQKKAPTKQQEVDTSTGPDKQQEQEVNNNIYEEGIASLEDRYKDLQKKYFALETDRAFGEFQLRDRITNDALKYHRRLRHWKEQNQELQKQLEQCMEQHATEEKALRHKLAQQEQRAWSAEQDLKEFKQGTSQSLKELCLTQERLVRAEKELEKYRPSNPKVDVEVMQQANLLQAAKDRLQEKNSWSTRFTGVLRRGDPSEQRQQAMG